MATGASPDREQAWERIHAATSGRTPVSPLPPAVAAFVAEAMSRLSANRPEDPIVHAAIWAAASIAYDRMFTRQ